MSGLSLAEMVVACGPFGGSGGGGGTPKAIGFEAADPAIILSNGNLTATHTGGVSGNPVMARGAADPFNEVGAWVWGISVDAIGGDAWTFAPAIAPHAFALNDAVGYNGGICYFSSGELRLAGTIVHSPPSLTVGMGAIFAVKRVGSDLTIWVGTQATAGSANAVTWSNGSPAAGTGGQTTSAITDPVPFLGSWGVGNAGTMFSIASPPTGFTSLS